MKRFTGTAVGCLWICVSVCLVLAMRVGAIEYVESSNGLGYPQWEGGRTDIEMADVNQDGNVDLVSIGDHGSPYINTQEHGVMVYFGDGEGRWLVFMNGNFGYGGICVGDVNGDGFPDVGYGMHHNYSGNDFGDQLIEVALGDGTGQNWTPWDDNLASQGESWGMFSTDFGDVDNDGDLDIVATSFGSGNPLQVYLNNGDGTWTHSQAVTPGPNNDMHVFFGDINRDGNLDIATAYQSGTVFFGYGNGQFYNADYNLPPGGTYGRDGCSLGDVDGDGGMDLAYVSGGGVQVWVFDEASTQWVNYSGNLPTSGSYNMTQLYDMDADGFCDVAAAGGGRVTVWTGDGAGNWTPAATYVIENDPDCIFEAFRVGGDADHNGYPDMLHLTDEGSWISSYNHMRCYKENSLPTQLTVMPTFPRGDEVFPGGSVRFTDWLSALPGGVTSGVKIELSTSGSSGPWAVLGETLPNNGRLQWTIPTGETSSNCYLRYTVSTSSDTVVALTPGPFTILGTAPDVQISLEPVNPPIIIPASGGSFEYVIGLTNNETFPVGCSVWIDATLPGGSTYGPIINVPVSAPVGTVTRTRIQNVPANAPAGEYSYNAYVGIYPGTVWSSASFPFTKSSMGDQAGVVKGWWTDFDGFDREELMADAPSGFRLIGAYPNPFNPTTIIRFNLPQAGWVRLDVFDVSGRAVGAFRETTLQPLVNGWREAGTNEVKFDGSGLPSGIYLARLTVGDWSQTVKMVLMK